MIIEKSSVFNTGKMTVFHMLQKPETLRAIAWPYMSFEPVSQQESDWAAGNTADYHVRCSA